MTEQHGHELAPTTESAGVALGPVFRDGPLKLGAGKQLQHLAENAGYSCHGGGWSSLWFTSLNANGDSFRTVTCQAAIESAEV